jgi:hypothetical protein
MKSTYPIKSYWQTETGQWDDKTEKFTNRKVSEITEREIYVTMDWNYEKNKKILQFKGGPTGHESYYFKDLEGLSERKNPNEYFCICGGTINSWPKCSVKTQDLIEIIDQIKSL